MPCMGTVYNVTNNDIFFNASHFDAGQPLSILPLPRPLHVASLNTLAYIRGCWNSACQLEVSTWRMVSSTSTSRTLAVNSKLRWSVWQKLLEDFRNESRLPALYIASRPAEITLTPKLLSYSRSLTTPAWGCHHTRFHAWRAWPVVQRSSWCSLIRERAEHATAKPGPVMNVDSPAYLPDHSASWNCIWKRRGSGRFGAARYCAYWAGWDHPRVVFIDLPTHIFDATDITGMEIYIWNFTASTSLLGCSWKKVRDWDWRDESNGSGTRGWKWTRSSQKVKIQSLPRCESTGWGSNNPIIGQRWASKIIPWSSKEWKLDPKT
jgi:hypothetical protein